LTFLLLRYKRYRKSFTLLKNKLYYNIEQKVVEINMGKRKISEKELKQIIGAGKFSYSFNSKKNKKDLEDKNKS
jgi:hypothetical protein